MNDKRDLLRHTLATVAYRGGKAIRGAPSGFSAFRAGPTSRTAGEILAHIGDLFDWALTMAAGSEKWHNADVHSWDADSRRLFDSISALDAYLESDQPLACSAERLFQGPIADALTHVGQIAMLRRLAGGPIRGENYSTADIVSGRVGTEQSAPRREFN